MLGSGTLTGVAAEGDKGRPFYKLESTCVVDNDRLDIEKMKGIKDPRIRKHKEEYIDNDWKQMPCDHEQTKHYGTHQIFPIMQHINWRSPTTKHHCKRTAIAASLRACSNKVRADPRMWAKFEKWFKTDFTKKFDDWIENDSMYVDIESWLNSGRYNEQYKKLMRKAFDQDHRKLYADLKKEHMPYEAFAKIEQQISDVLHEYKDTPDNKVKERQICGPLDAKKVMANAFCNAMEGLMDRKNKHYCGRKNWIQICAALNRARCDIPDGVDSSYDFSGYDMTMLQQDNALVYDLMMRMAVHRNTTFIDPLSVEDLQIALDKSYQLRVYVDNRGFSYVADGRASGDGWTTLANTILSCAYYEFCMYEAGIPEDRYFIMAKGDDVLVRVSSKYITQYEETHKKLFTDTKVEQTHGLGKICTDKVTGDILDMPYLSNHFFEDEYGNLRMTRIPLRVIQTISWTTKLHDSWSLETKLKIRKQLCYSKGKCLLAWAEGLPIWDVLARKMIELGEEGKHTEYDKYADKSRTWHKGRDDRQSYLRYLSVGFDMNEFDVQEIERKIQSITDLSGEVFIPQLEKFYNPFRTWSE